MALAGAPGAENPSAAFLAGQAHGASLAVKHSMTGAKPPAKPTASPTKKPGKPASPPAQTLLQQAQAIAKAQTDAQIAAIRQQQDLYNSQALAKAGQINSATKAAAQLLQNWNLGGATAQSYDQAAQTIGGLAGGFSGQTGADAKSAAAQVQANLASLGAPSGGAKTSTGQVSDPAALQNVLYGLGGFIPGNLLETTGQAQAAVARGLPASLLSYGQNQAAGAVSAGQSQADTLTPQILDAQGKLPQLVQQALAGLSDAQQRAFMNSLAVAKYKTGISEFNTKTTLQYKQLNLQAQKAAQAAYNADRNYRVALANLGIRQRAQQIAALKDEAKIKNGGFTTAQIQKYTGLAATLADNAKNGFSKGTTNYPPISYQQAIREARKEGIPVSIAQAELDKVYKPGEQGRPLINNGAAPPFDFSGSSFPGVGTSPFAASGRVAAVARSFLGAPYQWGGTSAKTGLDCSAFLQQVYAKMGIRIARTTFAQVKQGQAVPLGELQAGDAIFTEPGKNGPNHVGLYLGNGLVQESPHTGDVNKIISLQAFLSGGFVAARRYG